MYIKTVNSPGSLVKPPISEKLKSGCVILKTGEAVGEHTTDAREEILVILEGMATVICESETAEVKPGSIVYIPENKKHNVINKSPEVLKYIYIVTPI